MIESCEFDPDNRLELVKMLDEATKRDGRVLYEFDDRVHDEAQDKKFKISGRVWLRILLSRHNLKAQEFDEF